MTARLLPHDAVRLIQQRTADAFNVSIEDILKSDRRLKYVRPKRAATLSAEVADEIIELVGDLREGTAVRMGQVLVGIDDRRYVPLLPQAQAQVAVVQAEIDELDERRANREAPSGAAGMVGGILG